MFKRILVPLLFVAAALTLLGCGAGSAQYRLIPAVDHDTGKRIQETILSVRIIKDQAVKNIEVRNFRDYTLKVPVGAKAIVHVAARGYHDWVIEINPNETELIIIPVHLEPVDTMNG